MTWFKNQKISQKMIIGFLVVAIIAAIVGVVGIINISVMKRADTKLYKNEALALQYAGDTAVNFQQLRYYILKMTTLETPDEIAETKPLAEQFQQATNDGLSKLMTIEFDNDEIVLLNEQIKSNISDYETDLVEYLKLMESGKKTQADELAFGTMAPLGSALRDDFIKMMSLVAEDAAGAAADNAKTADLAIIIMIAVVVVAVVMAILLGAAISGIISKPIRKLGQLADMLAVGNIDVQSTMSEKEMLIKEQKDEIGSLALSFHNLIVTTTQQVRAIQAMADGDLTVDFTLRSEKDMLGIGLMQLAENLNQLIGSIATSSDQVTSGSSLVSHSSMALSQGATEQASAVQQLTASLQEISAQTHTNAQNAGKANELARNAKENAANGNGQMQAMLKAMEDINMSSSSINKIIKVIDDIAFQTNILALNAAVEAARAGQHGKGFAVVAEEVRTLAARSANAAKETTALIEGSINKVENGTKIANVTANALVQIVDQVDKAANLVNFIAVASEEQAHGIEQISLGIVQVSQVVQTNAATAEESAAASEELSAQAEQLNQTIGVFKTKKSAKAYAADTSRRFDTQPNKRQLPGRITQASTSTKGKIVLSDDDFGKY